MSILIYHNPRCSKSRKTLELIEESGIGHRIVEYLKEPPNAAELRRLADMLGVPLAEMLRKSESEFAAAGDLPLLSDDQALSEWLQRHPAVLQRPIVVDEASGRAVIGRPPENVTALFST